MSLIGFAHEGCDLHILAVQPGNWLGCEQARFGSQCPHPGQFTLNGQLGVICRTMYAQHKFFACRRIEAEGVVLRKIEQMGTGASGFWPQTERLFQLVPFGHSMPL